MLAAVSLRIWLSSLRCATALLSRCRLDLDLLQPKRLADPQTPPVLGSFGDRAVLVYRATSTCLKRAFYQRLLATGKPREAAPTAFTCKLLTILTSMFQHRSPWHDVVPAATPRCSWL